MTRAVLLVSAAAITLSSAAPAAAPPYETPAPIAYLVDLSSGAELFVKDADRRIPPASMAKMMETELAFELIDKGQLSLSKMCTVQPATWQKWHGPAAGSTMFLSPGEQVSVENLLHGIVTLSGNDAAIVLAECVAGTEQAYVAQENELAKKLGLTNSYFGTPNGWPDNDVTMVTARDLVKLARASIERHPELYKKFYAQTSFTWGKTLGAGKDITQDNRNPLLGRVAGADGLKTGHTEEAGYGFTGSAVQNGRRLIVVMAGMTSFNQRIEEGVRLMNWGFNAWTTKPLYAAGATVGVGQGPDGLGERGQPGQRQTYRHHRTSRPGQPDQVHQDPIPGTAQGADRQGRSCRRSRRDDGQWSTDHAACRRRSGRRGGFLRTHLDRAEAIDRDGLIRGAARAVHQP